jgi:hypothetical protein
MKMRSLVTVCVAALTAAAASDAQPRQEQPPEARQYVGFWRNDQSRRDGDLHLGWQRDLTIRADGSFTHSTLTIIVRREYSNDRTETLQGTWQAQNGEIVFTPQNMPPLRYKAQLQGAPGKRTLRLQSDKEDVTFFERTDRGR